MSRTTRFLKLFLPEDNDYYRVEEDQNENFEKIDKKLEEWDKGKEATIKYKKTGFNLDKTDSYEENNTNKLATARALYLLWEAFKAKIKAIKLTWGAIEEKPSTFPPSSHNHDDRYYTETETDTKLNNLAGKKDGTFPLSNAMRGNVYYLPSTNKYYFCKENYDGYQISVPNSSFIEMSVYENLNRLNNLQSFKAEIIYNNFNTGKESIAFDVKKYKFLVAIGKDYNWNYYSTGIIPILDKFPYDLALGSSISGSENDHFVIRLEENKISVIKTRSYHKQIFTLIAYY